MLSRSEVADGEPSRQLGAAWGQPRVELIGAEAWQDAISTRLVRCGSNTRCDLMHLPYRQSSPVCKYGIHFIEFCRMTSNNRGRDGDSRTIIKV